jgi:fluoride exporter
MPEDHPHDATPTPIGPGTHSRPGARGRFDAARTPPAALPIDPDLDPDDPGEPSSTHRPSSLLTRPHRVRPLVLVAILAGGALGTLGRYELGLAWPARGGTFPLTTFTINTTGALALGAVLTVVLARQQVSHYLRPFLGTGLLGGWTTYSTFVVDAAGLGRGDHLVLAVAYLLATLAAGVAAVGFGIHAARVVLRRGERGPRW